MSVKELTIIDVLDAVLADNVALGKVWNAKRASARRRPYVYYLNGRSNVDDHTYMLDHLGMATLQPDGTVKPTPHVAAQAEAEKATATPAFSGAPA